MLDPLTSLLHFIGTSLTLEIYVIFIIHGFASFCDLKMHGSLMRIMPEFSQQCNIMRNKEEHSDGK